MTLSEFVADMQQKYPIPRHDTQAERMARVVAELIEVLPPVLYADKQALATMASAVFLADAADDLAAGIFRELSLPLSVDRCPV